MEGPKWAKRTGWVCVALVMLAGVAALSGQQLPSTVPQTEEQKVDVFVSEMLGAWQIGDLELLHKYHAEDVMVVSGAFEPPIVGWTNYAQAYMRQRERVEQVRMERVNSFLTLRGNVAWMTYQWDFTALVQGQAARYQGHTSLVMEKRKDRWMVVFNHTSAVGGMQQPATAQQPPKQQP